MNELTIGSVKIMRGDCMDYLRELPDKHFKIAVVDPPYSDANQGVSNLRNGGMVRPLQASQIRSLTGIFARYDRITPPTMR